MSNVIAITGKICTKCKAWRAHVNFSMDKSSKDGFQSRCKTCQKEDRDDYYKSYPEKRYYYRRKSQYKLQYGITLDDYDKMFELQTGRCKICNRTQPNKRLAVDHDHKTNKVRGLLCDSCNRAIGLLGDSEEVLLSAIKYLKGE